MKAMKALTRQELVDMGTLIVMGKASDLMLIEANPDATALEKMVGSIVSNIMLKGDMGAFNLLLDRLIGKVKDDLHHHHTGDVRAQVIVSLPANGREAPGTLDL